MLSDLTAQESNLQAMLDPRRIVRWVYVARLTIAAAIYLAAVFVWQSAAQADTLIASLGFAGAMVFTAGSATWSEINRRPLGRTFLYLQAVFDLLLVTAVVHVTGGSTSQFAALFILVIAIAALLLPTGGALLVALLGCVLYFADVLLGHATAPELGVVMQLLVFGTVALGSGWISARLKQAGAGKAEELAAELVMVRMQAADILRNVRTGILTVNSDGVLLYANPAAGALLGLDLEELLGKPVLAAMAPLAPELVRALDRTISARIRTTRAEGLISDGARAFPIGVTTTWSEGDPRTTGTTATAIFQDISDQKQVEALHLRAERLQAVAELSASLAHEIKNPLASIRSAVEQLAAMAAADDDSRTLSTLIVRESDRLSRLLSEFLDFARVRVTQIERIDLGVVARDAANLVMKHPDRHEGISVDCTIAPGSLAVDGDDDLLHRAIFNLALNAVQAVQAGGHVTIDVAPVPADQLPGGLLLERGAVSLRVSDNGPGVPESIRDRLFEPFITTKPGGSGLGLPVVHRAIEAHRGLVLVDTTSAGTRFSVFLPRAHSDNGELA